MTGDTAALRILGAFVFALLVGACTRDLAPEHAAVRRLAETYRRTPTAEGAEALARALFPSIGMVDELRGTHDPARLLDVRFGDARGTFTLRTHGETFEVRPDSPARSLERAPGVVRAGPARVWLLGGGDALGHGVARVEEFEIVDGEGAWRGGYTLTLPDGAFVLHRTEGSIELARDGGPPLLRLHDPEARDVEGGVFRAQLQASVALDTPVRGAVHVSCALELAGARGPVVVDPGFSSTGVLATPRRFHSATALLDGRVLFVGGSDTSALASVEAYEPGSATFRTVASLPQARTGHAAVLLEDGRVLVAGGRAPASASYVYTPSTDTWATVGGLSQARAELTLTRILDGRVLAAGGVTAGGTEVAELELYDVRGARWSSGGALTGPRRQHAATLLTDGRVLLSGGLLGTAPLATAEVFEPASGLVSPAPMAVARAGHGSARLPDGSVLVYGGVGASGALASAERFDTGSGTWRPANAMSVPRAGFATSALSTGELLVAGGGGGADASTTELYDPSRLTWRSAPALGAALTDATATVLFDGSVLIAGGTSSGSVTGAAVRYVATPAQWIPGAPGLGRSGHRLTELMDGRLLASGGVQSPTTNVRVYDPTRGAWSTSGGMGARMNHSATLLHDGRVLITGGKDASGTPLATTAFFRTGTSGVTVGAALASARSGHTAHLLADASVLVVGGLGASGPVATAERWDPRTNLWTTLPGPSVARTEHAAVLLADGRVLVAGGRNASGVVIDDTSLFDPATGTWTSGGPLQLARADFTLVTAANGRVLAIGGTSGSATLREIEAFDPVTATWRVLGNLLTARQHHSALALADGRVLVVGGRSGAALTAAEFVDPVTGTSVALDGTSVAHDNPQAVALGNGLVLVSGDSSAATAPVELLDLAAVPVSRQAVVSSPRRLVETTNTLAGTNLHGAPTGSGRTDDSPAALRIALQGLGGGPWWPLGVSGLTETTGELAPPAGVPTGLYALWRTGGGATAGRLVRLKPRPTGEEFEVTTTEDTGVSFVLRATDPLGEALTFTLLETPASGTLTGTPPTLRYEPAPNATATVRLSFTVSDGESASAPAWVSIAVTPVDDAPSVLPLTLAMDEDGTLPFTFAGTDVEGDALTYRITFAPAHGTVSGTGADRTYTPAADWSGTERFTYVANDGSLDSAPQTVSITVRPANDAPVLTGTDFTTTEDTPVVVPFTLTDTDGPSPPAVVVVASPAHGRLVGGGTALTYLPEADFAGTDSFRIAPTDGLATGASRTLTVTVTPVNDPPRAESQRLELDEDTTRAILLGATDVDGPTLRFVVDAPPRNGTLTGTAPQLTYVPAPDFAGIDTFEFHATDGAASSDSATVIVVVAPVNDRPTALAQSVTVPLSTPTPIRISGTDPEGTPLTYAVGAQPAHGVLTGTAPDLIYRPATDYIGPDLFTFRVSDGHLLSLPVAVAITVSGTPTGTANSPPVAESARVTMNEDQAADVLLGARDPDGDALTWALLSLPLHGTLTGTAPNLRYVPAADFWGEDAIRFQVHDGRDASSVAVVTLAVTSIDDPPKGLARTVRLQEDGSVAIRLDGSDAEGQPLHFAIVRYPGFGELTGTPPDLTYAPVANYAGLDTFTFRVSDGLLSSPEVTITLDVTPVNDPPTSFPGSAALDSGTTANIRLRGTDFDSPQTWFTVTRPPAHGTLSGTPPDLRYTPDAGFSGPDTLRFRVDDGQASSAEAEFTFAVRATVAPVEAVGQQVVTNEDAAIDLALGSRGGGSLHTYTIVTPPKNGALTGDPPGVRYTPDPDFSGSDVFTFRASDGVTTSAAATVAILVVPVNDRPVASPRTARTDEGRLPLRLDASDPDGDALSWAIDTPPPSGTLSGTLPDVTYVAAPGFHGEVSFVFSVSDGALRSAPAEVRLTIGNVSPVVAIGASATRAVEGEAVSFSATAEDANGDSLTFAWDFGDGETANTPAATHAWSHEGPHEVTLTVDDGIARTQARVDVQVGNAAPIVVPLDLPASVAEGATFSVSSSAIDPGADDALAFAWDFGDGSTGTTGPDATHAYADDGAYVVRLTVTDGEDETVLRRVVEVENTPPVFTPIAAQAADAARLLTVPLAATDVAGALDPLTFSLVEGPGQVGAEGTWTFAPTARDVGAHVVKVRVTDDDGGIAETVFGVVVHEEPVMGGGCGCGSGASGLTLGLVALLRRRRRA